MFRLNPAPTFKVDVPLSVAGMDKPLAISVEFRHKNATGLQDWLRRAGERTDVENLADVIAGWSGVMGDDGQPVPYTLTALGTLLENYPAAKWELLFAYKAELTEAKRKN